MTKLTVASKIILLAISLYDGLPIIIIIVIIHMSEVLDLLKDLMNRIDSLSCHPKNKLVIYHQFVLSKLSWHLTVADLIKTWVVQNLGNIVTKYVRQWLDLPISATLSTLVLQKPKYGINLILPSTKFTQCQTIIKPWPNALDFSLYNARHAC